jgi:hypothetical protein
MILCVRVCIEEAEGGVGGGKLSKGHFHIEATILPLNGMHTTVKRFIPY